MAATRKQTTPYRTRVVFMTILTLISGSVFGEDTTQNIPSNSNSSNSVQKTATKKKKKKKKPVTKKTTSLQKKTVGTQATAKTSTQTAPKNTLALPSPPANSSAKLVTQTVSAPIVSTPAPAPTPTPNPFIFNLGLEFYGPSAIDPLSGYQPDIKNEASQSDSTTELDVHVVLGYKISPNLTLSLNPYFQNYNQSKYDPSTSTTIMKPMASYIKLGFGSFVTSGNFKWNGDVRAYPGVTDDMKGLPLVLRTGQNLMYALNPKWTLAAYNTFRYAYQSQGVLDNSVQANGNIPWQFEITSSPTVEFQPTDNFGVSLSYNIALLNPYYDDITTWADAPGSAWQYFELGCTLQVGKSTSFYPYIDVYKNHFDPNASQLGLNVMINFL